MVDWPRRYVIEMEALVVRVAVKAKPERRKWQNEVKREKRCSGSITLAVG